MADDNQQEESSNAEQDSGAGKEGASDVAARLAALEAENRTLQDVAKGATKEAEGAKAYVASLMSTLQAAAERGNGPLAEGQEQPDPENMKEQFDRDPLTFMDKHFQARTAPLVSQSLEISAKQNREIARLNLSQQKLWDDPDAPTVWGRYGEKIDEFMSKFGPDVRSQADAYDAAVRWVRSQHIDEELKERIAKEKERANVTFAEGASAGAGAGKKKTIVLSDAEKTVARKLGITEEDYLQYRDAGAGE